MLHNVFGTTSLFAAAVAGLALGAPHAAPAEVAPRQAVVTEATVSADQHEREVARDLPLEQQRRGEISPTVIGDFAPASMAGWGMQFDLGQYANTPTVAGAQICDPANEDAQLPTAGRQWMYYDGTNGLSEMSATLTVTAFELSKPAFKDVSRDTGLCSLMGYYPVKWEGTNPSTHLLLTDGDDYAAVVREGYYIVAVQVNSGDHSAAEARAAAIQGVEDTLALM